MVQIFPRRRVSFFSTTPDGKILLGKGASCFPPRRGDCFPFRLGGGHTWARGRGEREKPKKVLRPHTELPQAAEIFAKIEKKREIYFRPPSPPPFSSNLSPQRAKKPLPPEEKYFSQIPPLRPTPRPRMVERNEISPWSPGHVCKIRYKI